MPRHLRSAAIAAFLLILGGEVSGVRAQGPQFRPGPSGGAAAPNYGPAVSPYLNLLRGGSSQAINYYGLVKPAVDFQNSINNLQQQVSDIPGTGSSGSDLPPLITGGNRARFLNTGNYFQSGIQTGNLGGRGVGGSGGGRSGSVFIVNTQSMGSQSNQNNPGAYNSRGTAQSTPR